MKIRTKLAITAAAVLLTFAGFNLLISSSTLDLVRAGKTSGMEIVVTAKALPPAPAAHTS